MKLGAAANRLKDWTDLDADVFASEIEREVGGLVVPCIGLLFATCDQVVNQGGSRLLEELLNSLFGCFCFAHVYASMNCSGIDTKSVGIKFSEFRRTASIYSGANWFIFHPGGSAQISLGPSSCSSQDIWGTSASRVAGSIDVIAAAIASSFLKNVLRSIGLFSFQVQKTQVGAMFIRQAPTWEVVPPIPIKGVLKYGR